MREKIIEDNEKAVVVENLSKAYITRAFEIPPVRVYRKISGTKPKIVNRVDALKNITFTVDSGEIFGIIGPDGAGKTTLFRILTTLLLADSGTATVAGHNVVEGYETIRHLSGYMPGRFSLYQDMSVEENLQFFATLFGTTIEENYHLIEDIYKQIEPFKTRYAGALSGGMKQKLALCCALIHKPKVLFLDEPTTGVDPVSRKEFWEMLRRLKKEGITILVSTPYMDEAVLCDRIALIDQGEFITIAPPQEIIEKYPHTLYAVAGNDMYDMLLALRQHPNTHSCYAFGDALHLTLHQDNSAAKQEILDFLKTKKFANVQIETITPNIEDCYMAITHSKHE